MQAGSIVVKDENLQGHLGSPDFFDLERYPEIRFVSSQIRRNGMRSCSPLLGAAGARVVDRELPVASADEAFDESGALAEPDLSLELGNILIELVELAERRRIAA